MPVFSKRTTRAAGLLRALVLLGCGACGACGARAVRADRPTSPGGAQASGAAVPAAPLRERCELRHELTGAGDTIDARIEQLAGDEWIVSMRMNVRLEGDAPVPIRGLGRVHRRDGMLRCQVVETDGPPGAPRFDEAVCLDEVDSLRDRIADVAQQVRPGETVEVEVALRAPTAPARSRSRRRLPSLVGMAHRAELSRDARGRVIRIAEEVTARREVVTVQYDDDALESCLPAL